MSIPPTEPAPFAPGDRVIYRPRPAGIETVELVDYRHEGWGGWYVRTKRQVGPTETWTHHYDRAELFELVAAAAPEPIATRLRRRLRRRLCLRWPFRRQKHQVHYTEIPPRERARAVAGAEEATAWPAVERRGLAGLIATGSERS